MALELLPYILLALSVLFSWRANRNLALVSVGVSAAAALILQRMDTVALVAIFLCAGSLFLGSERAKSTALKLLSYSTFFIFAVLLSNHLAPGFNNLLVYDKVQFSPNSIPFSMYLNFDKTLVGIFIFIFILRKDSGALSARRSWSVTFLTLLALIGITMPIALAIGFVKFDAKFPFLGWLWALNNFLFVCLAEEALFRGFIQRGLTKMFNGERFANKYFPVLVAAILFGLAHYKGGLAYVALATIAGCFYGYAYMRTNRIEYAMLTHFGFNLIHFLLFSYPALQH